MEFNRAAHAPGAGSPGSDPRAVADVKRMGFALLCAQAWRSAGGRSLALMLESLRLCSWSPHCIPCSDQHPGWWCGPVCPMISGMSSPGAHRSQQSLKEISHWACASHSDQALQRESDQSLEQRGSRHLEASKGAGHCRTPPNYLLFGAQDYSTIVPRSFLLFFQGECFNSYAIVGHFIKISTCSFNMEEWNQGLNPRPSN